MYIHWYELFSSVPILYFMANFVVHTPLQAISPAPHNTLCPNDSSVQGSAQSVSNINLKLPSSTIKNALTAGCLIESSISCSVWTKVQWKCVHCSSRVQVPCHSLKPLGTAHGPRSKLLSVYELSPNLDAIQRSSSHHSIHLNSSNHHTRNCPCEKCQCDASVQILEFLNLSLILVFQDWINQFSRFCRSTNLLHLWNLWISPHSPRSLFCHHSWTITCSVCHCQMMAYCCLLRALQSR